MAFWDDFFKRVKDTADEAETTLKKEATRRAASAALGSLKKKASDLAEDFVSTAERELEEARSGRPDAPEYKPSGSDLDSDVDELIAEASALEADHRASRLRPIREAGPAATSPAPTPPKRKTLAEQRAEREERARQELAAMKARLAGGDPKPSATADDEDDAGAPPKRTL